MTWWEKRSQNTNKKKKNRVKKFSNKYTKQERNNLKNFYKLK